MDVLISRKNRGNYFKDNGDAKLGAFALRGASIGAVVFGIIGAVLLGLSAIGTSVAIPSMNLIVGGTLLAGAVGGAIGILAGALTGGMLGFVIHKHQVGGEAQAVPPIDHSQFHSCFISYSSKDEECADRLYEDLQGKGVRCWFAPEDLKIGDRFRERIDESILLHDKLLLILSANSVSSQWVGDEVEAALERERREKRTILFPVKIDNTVVESETGWAATIRRSRHIADFRQWKNQVSYMKVFERLLRDLKAETGK